MSSYRYSSVPAPRYPTERASCAADSHLDAATGRVVDAQTAYPGSLQLIRTLGGLHYGYYAAPLLRALYFLLALSGAAMIATGLVLYTARPAAAASRFGRAAHRLNVAMICGPTCACAAYLLANRLAWPHAAGLHEREVTAFFLAWMVCGVHALVRGERPSMDGAMADGGAAVAGRGACGSAGDGVRREPEVGLGTAAASCGLGGKHRRRLRLRLHGASRQQAPGVRSAAWLASGPEPLAL
ncbi:hypothetical protein DAI43_02710 [Achromobacter xylosoxidans]|nr:hypothetical protein DAI43_02710 [Achromobacter xylosoxidans]